jgi:hypothetical protein
MATNKRILQKGILFLSAALPLLFIGPVVINSSFKNKENPIYPFILGFGVLLCASAIFCLFRGINLIMKSLFDGDK